MTLAAMVDKWCEDAKKRLHKAIDRRAQIAHGRHPNTASRSVGQLYRDREAEKQREYDEVQLRR